MTNKIIKYRPVNEKISELAGKHQNKPEAILEMLSELQEQRGILEAEAITDIARSTKIPPAAAYGVASFYSMLNLKEKADYEIKVCDGPVCWLCAGGDARQEVEQAFRGKSGWKVSRTSCLGLCDRAPAMLVNGQQAGPAGVGSAGQLESGWRGQSTDYSHPRKGELRVMMEKAGID